MDYGWIILMSVVSFTMLNAAPLAGAWMLAEAIAGNCYSRWALTGFIFMLESLLICGGCGAAGVLNLQGAIISSVAVGIAVILLAHKLKQKKAQDQLRLDRPKKSYPERIVEALLWRIGLFVCIKSAYLPGTDTIIIEDTMTPILSVYWDTIKLFYEDENGEWIDFHSENSVYEYSVTYDQPTNKLTFTLYF